MILRAIRVESLRCFTRPLCIPALDERITVLHGPNATGKSSLLAALERGLFDRPDGKSSELQKLVPFGAEVSPRVTIDFEHDGVLYRIEKRFITRPEAILSRAIDPNSPTCKWESWKEGEAAVDFVREILGGRAPGLGATKSKHRGLAQVLFVQQGEVVRDENEPLAEGAAERLRAVVGSVTIDAATRALEAALDDAYDTLFTEKGKDKAGAPALVCEKDLASAKETLARARAAWERIDEIAHVLGELQARVASLEERKAQLAAERELLKPRVASHARLRRECDDKKRMLEDARRAFDKIAKDIETIRKTRESVAEWERRVETLARDESAAAIAANDARHAHEGAVRARQAHDERRSSLREERRRAEEAKEFERARAEIASAGPRLERIRSLTQERASIAARLAAAKAPSGQRIKALRDALAEERSCREALSALKLRIRLEAKRPLRLDAGPESLEMQAGEVREIHFEGSGTLSIDDRAILGIFGPTKDVAAAKQSHLVSLEKIDVLAVELGSSNPEELEERRAREKSLESEHREVTARLGEQLRNGETEESLARNVEQARTRLEDLLEVHPGWRDTPPDADGLKQAISDAEREFDIARTRLEGAEAARKQDRVGRDDALEECRTRLGAARTELAQEKGRLRTLVEDGLTDERREELRYEASRARQGAEDSVRLTQEALLEFDDDPAKQDQRLENEQRALNDELPKQAKELGRREDEMRQASSEAPYSALARCEESVAFLEGELVRLRIESDATRLLHDLFASERKATVDRLVAPISARVMPRLRLLAGPSVEAISFDEQFRPSKVRIRGVPDPVEPDSLSFGTRDQLALLVRLALGEIVANGRRLPAVLDDPMVHADRSRIRRFLAVLEDASQHLQLILLTCRPEDYQGLTGAKFIDLASLVQGSGGS